MAEELKKEMDSSTMLERMKRNMESTVKGSITLLTKDVTCHSWLIKQWKLADQN